MQIQLSDDEYMYTGYLYIYSFVNISLLGVFTHKLALEFAIEEMVDSEMMYEFH